MEPVNGPTWTQAVFVLGMLAIFATVGIVVVWQALVTWRSRMSVAREEAYRNLAEQVTQAQLRIADSLEKAVTELSELRQRTAELERLLKEVD
jgi:hypothetical protein